MQYIYIPTSWGTDAIPLEYCPVCGAHLVSNTCPHLLFFFHEEVGEFTDVAPHLKNEIVALNDELNAMGEEERYLTYAPEHLAQQLDLETAVAFHFPGNVTGGGYTVAIDIEP